MGNVCAFLAQSVGWFHGGSPCLAGLSKIGMALPAPQGWSLQDRHGSARPTKECQSGCSGPDVFRKQGLSSPELFLESHFKLKLLILVHSPSLAKLDSQGLLPVKKNTASLSNSDCLIPSSKFKRSMQQHPL